MASVSVVIPSWNDAAMLEVCLAALARQSRPADEIVVVDNASTDETAAVARAAGARVVAEPRRGILYATAAGFDAARGDILARLDADSRPPEDWIERLLRDLETVDGRPIATAVSGPGQFYGGSALVHRLGRSFYIGGYFWFIGLLLGHPPLFGSNFALRREAWLRIREGVHLGHPRVHDDLDITWRIAPDMTVLYDPELVVGISARPFASLRAFGRRLSWAFATIALNWREDPPRVHRARRRRAARPAEQEDADPLQA